MVGARNWLFIVAGVYVEERLFGSEPLGARKVEYGLGIERIGGLKFWRHGSAGICVGGVRSDPRIPPFPAGASIDSHAAGLPRFQASFRGAPGDHGGDTGGIGTFDQSNVARSDWSGWSMDHPDGSNLMPAGAAVWSQ
jgi:hypothetical protein